MTIDEQYLIQLRDCFSAGYQMPQFCIDNDIKKPLFVGMDESQISFLWELHVQFKYDLRIKAEFVLFHGAVKKLDFSVAHVNSNSSVQIKNINDVVIEDFDRIILLTTNISVNHSKVISLQALIGYCIARAHIEIPLLHFMENHPGVILLTINHATLTANEYNSDYEKFFLENQISLPEYRTLLEDALKRNEIIKTPYDFLGRSNQEVMIY